MKTGDFLTVLDSNALLAASASLSLPAFAAARKVIVMPFLPTAAQLVQMKN